MGRRPQTTADAVTMAVLLRRSYRKIKPLHNPISVALSQSISPHPTTKPNYSLPNHSYYYDYNSLSRKPNFFYNSNFNYLNLVRLLGQNSYGISTSSHSLRRNEEEEEKEKLGNDDLKKKTSWIDLYIPKSVRPYAHLARLDKPIGTWLLAWPCMW